MKTIKTRRQQNLYLVQLALLSAIVIILNFTPLGFLKIGIVEMTFMAIPVLVGAVVLGPAAGAFLGLLFGICSLLLAPSHPLFSVALAEKPIFLAAVCIIPRVLIGLTSAYTAKIFKKHENTSYVLASLVGSLTNTVLFIGGVVLLLNQVLTPKMAELGLLSEKTFTIFWLSIAAINGIPEAIVSTIISVSIIIALKRLNATLK